MKKDITQKQKKVLELIYKTIKDSGFTPTLADIREALNLVSNQSVLNFLNALEENGYIEREEGQARGIKISRLGLKFLGKEKLIPQVGISSAGPFIETLEQTAFNWFELPGKVLEDEAVKKSKEEMFAITVYGDSMINAGIDDGDILLVKKSKEYKSGDIVVARTDDGTTVKKFIADGGKRYLKPENPEYKNIPIIPGEVQFEGKVILNLSKIK